MKTPPTAPHRLDYQIGTYALQAIIAGAVALALIGITIWMDLHHAAVSVLTTETTFCVVFYAFLCLRVVQVFRLLKQVHAERDEGTPLT